VDQLLTAMSLYFHTPRSSSVSARHADTTACHRQSSALPLIVNGPVIQNGPAIQNGQAVIHKYAVMMPSVQSFIKDQSSVDICAVIRHHILDQVTRAAPLVTARPTAIKDVPMSNRVHSNPSYGVRGTKFVFSTSLC